MPARKCGLSLHTAAAGPDEEHGNYDTDSSTSSSENETLSNDSEVEGAIHSQFEPLQAPLGSHVAPSGSAAEHDEEYEDEDEIISDDGSTPMPRVSRALARARQTLLDSLGFALAIWAKRRQEGEVLTEGGTDDRLWKYGQGRADKPWIGLVKALEGIGKFLGDRQVMASSGVIPCIRE